MTRDEALRYWLEKWSEPPQSKYDRWYAGGYASFLQGRDRRPGYSLVEDGYDQVWLMGYDDAKGDWG